MSDELLAQYKKLTGKLEGLEAEVTKTKGERAAIAATLFEKNGKAYVYEIDGVAMVITTSSTGTRYFTPKDKWAASGKPKKVKEPKPPKVKKGRVKKAIIGGKVVEVTDEAIVTHGGLIHYRVHGQAAEVKRTPVKTPNEDHYPPVSAATVQSIVEVEDARVLEELQAVVEAEEQQAVAKPHTMTRGHVTTGNPTAPKAPEAPAPTPEPPAKELDPVEAALAAIEGLEV